MARMVLLDRDGTINVERHYLASPEQVELLPGAAEGIRFLNDLGLPVAVVTNQSAVGRGYFGLDRLDAIHERLRELLARQGAHLDGILVCPHRPDETCSCRKPSPGLAHQAARTFGGDLKVSFVVGDKPCDVELGKQIGATTFVVRTGYGQHFLDSGAVRPDHMADNLLEAARMIESLIAEDSTRPGVGDRRERT